MSKECTKDLICTVLSGMRKECDSSHASPLADADENAEAVSPREGGLIGLCQVPGSCGMREHQQAPPEINNVHSLIHQDSINFYHRAASITAYNKFSFSALGNLYFHFCHFCFYYFETGIEISL